MPTDTKDTELFELCKAVWDKTGWQDGITHIYDRYDNNGEPFVPAYTSDYLLEKLPSWYFDTDIEETMILALMPHMLVTDKWIARYETPEHRGSEFEAIADTPLKALLKLALALHEAGELTNKRNAMSTGGDDE